MSQYTSSGSELHRFESGLREAVAAFQAGNPVLIHDFDDRECETDLVYPARAVEFEDVVRLRNDAGGLICVALGYEVANELGLQYLQDIVDHSLTDNPELSYDTRSAFSLTVNHRDTRTGITDKDRALTISELGGLASDPDESKFASEFRSPGHVHLLKGAKGLLTERRGHTELGLYLARTSDISQAVVVCEMLDDSTGESLSKLRAQEYAREHNIPFIDGKRLLEVFSKEASQQNGITR